MVGREGNIASVSNFVELLETGAYLTKVGVDITTFQPNEVHMTAARNAMDALGITSNTFADMQITEKMNLDQFERLLGMTNMLFKNDAGAISSWASDFLNKE